MSGAPPAMLEGSRCDSCGKHSVPLRPRCPKCGAATREALIEGRGKVLSWTTIHVTPEGVPSPRTVALVGLECGAALLCLVPDNRTVDIGQTVEIQPIGVSYHIV